MARITLTPNLPGRKFLTNFGVSSDDRVIMHVYNTAGNFIISTVVDPGDWYTSSTNSDGSIPEKTSGATLVDIEAALTKAGFSSGEFNVKLFFVRNHLTGIPIDEISEDFKEIKITGETIEQLNNDPEIVGQQYASKYHMLWSAIYRLHEVRYIGDDPGSMFTLPLIIEEGKGDVSHVINC